MPTVSNNDLVKDIRRVAQSLGLSQGDQFSRQEYIQKGGRFTHYQIYDSGRTWSELCAAAGFSTKEKKLISDEAYFQKLADAVRELGRYPKAAERKRFDINFSKRRFPTLTAFIEKAIELSYVRDLRPKRAETPQEPEPEPIDLVSPASLQDKDILNGNRPIPPIPATTKQRKWQQIGIKGFPYAPHNELGVVALFAILCANGTLDWEILQMNSKGYDAICFDHRSGKEVRVELKHILSRGSWNHQIGHIDYVVCWENRWKDFPKPVIELRQFVEKP